MTVVCRPTPDHVTRADVERLVRFDARGARILGVDRDLGPERHVTCSSEIVLPLREGCDGMGSVVRFRLHA
jgi:hypothetical protein